MKDTEQINRIISRLAWGALLIWWGMVIIIDPLTLAMGAIGTGLIFLGANAARALLGIPRYTNNYYIGAIAVTWGILDQARILLSLPVIASFALLLVVFGIAEWVTTLIHHTESEV